jgi:hypothetical protein
MIARRLTATLRRLLSPRAYRRLIRAGAILGAIASIYAFLTMDLFASLIAPESGRLTPTFSTLVATDMVAFSFANKTDIRVEDLNAAFGLYGADGLRIHHDTFSPPNMTVDAGIEKEGSESLSGIGADRAAIYYFCAEHKTKFPFLRVREIYLLVPSRFDITHNWRQAHYLFEVWRFTRPDCTPPATLPEPWVTAAKDSTQ